MPIRTKPIDKLDNGANGHAHLSEQEWAELAAAGLVEGVISEDGKAVSEEEYWRDYYEHPDFSYEWNNGILEEKPMADPFQYTLYDWFLALVRAYLEVYPIAKKMALEMGFRLEATDHVSVRKPDLFIVRNDNPRALGDFDRTYHGICDLCIESISDSTTKEIERDTKTKKQEYAAVGVREYFILDAAGEHTAFYRLAASGEYVDIEATPEGIIRSEVLPGFQFRLADLERKPPLIELAQDEVYSTFVLPQYQEAHTRAEQEHTRAEQERARAEQERARAERYAARLRELGIDVDAD